MRAAAACALLVLAALLVAVPVDAVDRVARSANVIVRERPGSANPGIAVLKRGDRVRFLGERDGWTEVGLRDGRTGWVLSAEIAPVVEPPQPNLPAQARVKDAVPTAVAPPSPVATARVSEPVPTVPAPRAEGESLPVEHGRVLARLESEIGQLRQSVDRLAADRPLTAPSPVGEYSDVLWTGMIAFAIGLIVGSIVQRRRSRRERTLRF